MSIRTFYNPDEASGKKNHLIVDGKVVARAKTEIELSRLAEKMGIVFCEPLRHK